VGGLGSNRFLWFSRCGLLCGRVGVGLRGFVGILVVWIGVRIGRRLVLGGRGMFLLCGFGIRLCGSGLGLSCLCRVVCMLWLLFRLFWCW